VFAKVSGDEITSAPKLSCPTGNEAPKSSSNLLDNRFDDDFGVGSVPLPDANFGTEVISSPETLANTETGENLVSNDERSDPPFRSCEAFEVKPEAEGSKGVKFVRSPSSAEYYIKGAISGERLKSIIQENGRSDATLSIVNDLHQIDNYPISNEINSKYVGQIIYYKENGAKKEVLNFRIDNINTECRYITLIQPSQKFSASQKNQWTPLTEEGKEKFEKHAIPGDKDAFEQIGIPAYNDNQLMSGESVLKFPTRTEPLSVLGLNPPFGPCVAVVESLGFTDDTADGEPDSADAEVVTRDNAQFAEYVMVGNLENKISSANKNGDEDILIKITADLNLLASDSAKITGNANPYVKVEIFLNPDQDPAQKIEFHLKELSYNCHGVGFAR